MLIYLYIIQYCLQSVSLCVRARGGEEGELTGVRADREEERIAVITLFYGGVFFYLIVCTKTRGKEKN